jgi:predicted DNA-binding transcriptional regulator AlpA
MSMDTTITPDPKRQRDYKYAKRLRAPTIPIEQLDATSLADCAMLCNISRSSLYKALDEGRGPKTVKVGDRRLITRQARLEWLASLPC